MLILTAKKLIDDDGIKRYKCFSAVRSHRKMVSHAKWIKKGADRRRIIRNYLTASCCLNFVTRKSCGTRLEARENQEDHLFLNQWC